MRGRFWKKTLPILCLAVALVSPLLLGLKTSAASGTLTDQTSRFVSGKEYVIASAGSIKDDKNVTYQNCAMLAVPVTKTGETVADSLDYAAMPLANPSDEFLWRITSEGNGYYSLYSVSQKKYLKLLDGQILLTEEKSTVKATFSGGNVTFENDNKEYLRFTNVETSRYHCGTLNARTFKLFAAPEVPKEYKETEEPLLSVACFSDMHHEYGIQYWSPPYRQSTQTAVNYIKNTLGKVDVLLIGGDITGRRNNSAGNDLVWTGGDFRINNLMEKNYELFQSATKTGSVMVVTGNHDPEPSVHMSGGYTTANSNDWGPYMEDGVGDFEIFATYADLNLSTADIPAQYRNEVLCYQYTVNGIPFLGLCTPFGDRRSVGQTGHNGLYAEQVEWLEDRLTALGKDKTAVVFCHYPVNSIPTVVNGGARQKVITSGAAQTKMNSVLNAFPNVIYAYGHIHGDNSRIAQFATSELVFPSGSSVLQSDNSYETTGWISAFMGSLGFYGNSHQNKLSDEEIKVVQLLVMNFYEDHITFELHNTGTLAAPGGEMDLVSFTVKRDLSDQLGEDSSGGGGSSTGTGSTSTKPTDTGSSDTGTPSDQPSDGGKPSDSGASSATDRDGSGSAILWILIGAGGLIFLGGVGVAVFLLLSRKRG